MIIHNEALLPEFAKLPVIIGRCEFYDGMGQQCAHTGKRLTLRNEFGYYVRRTLCRSHSDWVEAELPVGKSEKQP